MTTDNHLPENQEISVEATAEPAVKKHSKLGIASFILALVAGVVGLIGFFVAVMAAADMVDPSILTNEDALMASDVMVPLVLASFAIMGGGFLSFIGFILGVVSLFMKEVKKGFGIAGVIMNVLPLIITILLTIIGLAAQGSAGF